APAPFPWALVLAAAWLAGSGAYLLVAALRLRRLGRLLAELPTAGIDLTSLAALLGLRFVPRVLLAPGRGPLVLSSWLGTGVLWASPEAGPAYAGALVEPLAFLSERPAGLPIAACGAGPVFALKRRLSMILQGSTPRRLSRAGLLLVALAGLLLPLTPTVAD